MWKVGGRLGVPCREAIPHKRPKYLYRSGGHITVLYCCYNDTLLILLHNGGHIIVLYSCYNDTLLILLCNA